mmetsp:Transcript_7177/g.13208  ORF Transcript_7177/g.13208 Transcript_7177/m.13208 type:complete len:282 (-) Transcript_7177:362-1207(-)
MCLVNDLQCKVLIQALVVVAKFVLWLSIRHLVVSEPDQYLLQLSWELLLDVSNVVDHASFWVVNVDSDDFPVKLTIVDHRVDSEHLHLVDTSHIQLGASYFDDVDRVVVPSDLAVLVNVSRILPRLWEQTVVPVDVVRVEPQVTLLNVLLDRGQVLVSRDFHLSARLLWNLADEVEGAVASSLEWNVMPRGHAVSTAVLEEDAKVSRFGLSSHFGLEGREQAPYATEPLWAQVEHSLLRVGRTEAPGCIERVQGTDSRRASADEDAARGLSSIEPAGHDSP